MTEKELEIKNMSPEEYMEYVEKNRWKHTLQTILKDWRLYLMLLPLILVFLFWRYIPLYGTLIGFKNFEVRLGVFKSDFVGFKYFQEFFFPASSNSAALTFEFWRAFRNTFVISMYGLLFGFPVPIIVALFFSEIKSDKYRSIMQIFTYLPRFVSLVVITTIITLMLREQTAISAAGFLNTFLQNIKVIDNKIPLNEPKYFQAIYQISGIWESAGYGSIVFFAAIMAISPTSYEAARIDGANKIQQIRHVTLPGMAPTLIVMLILRIGDLLSVGYEKVLLLYNTHTYETADVISTFVFRYGLSGSANTGRAAAADLFNSLIAMLMVIGANFIARKVSNTSLY